MNKIGMDVAKVRGVATSLTGQARRLDSVRIQVSRLVETAGRQWEGANSDRFAKDWNSRHQQELIELIRKLNDLAKKANDNADEQERTSGAKRIGGGVGSGTGSGGSGSGSGDPSQEDAATVEPPVKVTVKGDPKDPYKVEKPKYDPEHSADDPDYVPQRNEDAKRAQSGSGDDHKHSDQPKHADTDVHNPKHAEEHKTSAQGAKHAEKGTGGMHNWNHKTYDAERVDHGPEDRSKDPKIYVGKAAYADKGLASESDASFQKIKGILSGDENLVETQKVKGEASVWKGKVDGDWDLGNGVTASGTATASLLAASGSASAGISAAGLTAKAEGKATLVSAEAEGKVGNQYASLNGKASAEVGVAGSAEASLTKDGLKAGVGASAFAGVQASATAQVDVGGVKPSVTGHVYAGIGAHANADVEVTVSHVKASVDVGAALGVGAGVSFDVDVDVNEVTNNLKGLFKW
jgi:uncharacterized protein YukE